MIRILVAISLMALGFACANKDAGRGSLKLSGRHTEPENTTKGEDDSQFDSTFYIGYVDYFPETREFYTAVFYREGHEYPDEDLLEGKLDSVVLFDDDWGRERLPMAEAKKFLVLTGLDTLAIFNRHHQLVSRAPLLRVEYLWDGMENYFIAVYKSDTAFKEQTEELYGITSRYSSLVRPAFSAAEFEDPTLDELLLSKLKMSPWLQWDIRHYRVGPAGITYSVASSWSMHSNEAFSYLTAMESNDVLVLNEEVNNYHFLNILPVPIEFNAKPLLLISAGYPSSDVLWDYLARFDGTRYEPIEFNRVQLKTVGH